MIKGGTNWQDIRESLDTYVLFKFSFPKTTKGSIFSQEIVDRLVISFKLYELDLSIPSISVVLMQKMGVLRSSNTSVGGGGFHFMHRSLTLLVIVVIFTEYGLTISFPCDIIHIPRHRGTVFNHMREEKSK